MDTTLQSIIEIALQQGIWAALYIYLFFRMLKENAERETQYQQMINHLSTNVVEGIARKIFLRALMRIWKGYNNSHYVGNTVRIRHRNRKGAYCLIPKQ